MKLLFFTGSRGEWGYIKPLLKICKKRKIKYSICATNMHLLPSFGLSINEIKNDGFHVDDVIHMSLDGYDHFTMTKSMGILHQSFTDLVLRIKPDWIILAGDRSETLIASIVGAYTYTPVAHIQAGELSGNIDGLARHAIGKFSHLHFCSNIDAFRRLINLGEQKFRIHNVGAPQLDEIKKFQITSKHKNLIKKIINKKFMIISQHPVTEEFSLAEFQIKQTLRAINKFKDFNFVFILPNNDAGNLNIRLEIEKNRSNKTWLFDNLPRNDYLFLLSKAECLVGNSSSGLIEAPSFNLPAVNIGRRQKNRVFGKNVIHCSDFNEKKIFNSIKKAISKIFINKLKNVKNPYGDGNSAKKIVDILLKTKKNDMLLFKELTF